MGPRFIVEILSSKKLKQFLKESNVKSCLMFCTFEIGNKKPIKPPSFYTNLTNSIRRGHLKGAVFLQFPLSCKKLFKVFIKSLQLKILKIPVQIQKWNGLL